MAKLLKFHIPSFGKMNMKSDDVQNSARMQDILKLPSNESSVFLSNSNSQERKLFQRYCRSMQWFYL